MTDLTVNASPFKAVALSIVTRLIGYAGAALVTYGVADSDTVAADTPILAGAVMAIGGLVWGWYRAKHLNTKQNALAAANPGDVTVIGPSGTSTSASSVK